MAGRGCGRQSPEPEWMACPVFDVPLPGGGLLIAANSVFHAFIAHFSIGSG